MTVEDRFWSAVERGDEDECWEWQAATQTRGYGQIWVDGSLEYAHRVSMELHGENIGDKQVNHHCDNPSCVNPNHLYLGSQSENMQDAWDREQIEPTPMPGEKNPDSSLRREQVIEIRQRYQTESISQRELADDYGVTKTTIGHIVRRETWTHLEATR